ncbi:hypothetical protein EXT66_20880 [Pectobacterium carotovorum subsp. carotovorum]|nr:hypothetical protein [Pectobacterium carotovorum]MCL6336229.1 hypothetical protein [Pectobacterium carotovorum subsp. carotovorum]MCL6349209.1 hypothetical protein [Pectobacterium carotovorum subsp. carotovorum]MCL6403710.1 hypothetical protein [Pectobacterium carotovorum subsp. carotovorum]
MNIFKSTLSILLLLAPAVCFSEGGLTSHQVLVDCNRVASSLVGSYEKDVPLQESKRLDLLQIISGTCQHGYKNAYDGMQYEDVERDVLSNAKNHSNELKGESKKNANNRVGLVLAAIQSGYYIYHNGGLKNKK